ncbi:hypothetical protein BH09GEM1_BH09GEM1_09400 [soil metagenome]
MTPSVSPPRTAVDASRLLFLVVDDDAVDRMTVRRLLERSGLRNADIREAVNGVQAEAELSSETPVDCVILDFHLAGESGLDVLQEIRRTHRDTPVIVLTGRTDPQAAADLIKAGALEYLNKGGLSSDRLEQAIRSAIRVSRAEQQAQETQERLATTLRSIADAVVTLDREGRVVYLNDAAEVLTGWKAAEAMGRLFADVVETSRPDAPAGDATTLAECVASVLRGSRDQQRIALAMQTREGDALYVDATAAPLRDPHGDVVGAVIAIRDVTQRWQAERELAHAHRLLLDQAARLEQVNQAERLARESAESANRTKSEFLANMSHELRTPLNAIGGYTDLLVAGIRGPVSEAQLADLVRIKRSQHLLLALINDILNFAKIEAGRVQMHVREVSVNGVLTQLEALIGPQLLEKQLRYDYRPCDADVKAYVDPDRFQQILLNLVSNAVKFTNEQGRITVECATMPEAVIVRVIDTGVGIPSDSLESVFEPFVQLDRTRWTGLVGTGLGLAISRDLARAMDGELSAESELDVGSTFTLRVPMLRASGGPSTSSS